MEFFRSNGKICMTALENVFLYHLIDNAASFCAKSKKVLSPQEKDAILNVTFCSFSKRYSCVKKETTEEDAMIQYKIDGKTET